MCVFRDGRQCSGTAADTHMNTQVTKVTFGLQANSRCHRDNSFINDLDRCEAKYVSHLLVCWT